jgi:hypothetical protein
MDASLKRLTKPAVLFVGPTPPPYQRVAVTTDCLLHSGLAENFGLIHLDINDRRPMNNSEHLDFKLRVTGLRVAIFEPLGASRRSLARRLGLKPENEKSGNFGLRVQSQGGSRTVSQGRGKTAIFPKMPDHRAD